MDDVCTDWYSEARNYLNTKWEQDHQTLTPYSYWATLSGHTRFYRNMQLLPGAIELINWARAYSKQHNMELTFLTAIPADGSTPLCAYDKTLWAYERFPDIPVLFGPYSEDKHKHCKPGDILIDDRADNCTDWRKAGGIAHEYKTWEKCQHWINTLLPKQVKQYANYIK